MKTLLCRDLGGPENCTHAFSSETFRELGAACKAHVQEQLTAGDEAHQAAVERMKNASPEDQQKMFATYQKKWDATPENNENRF